MTHSLDEQPIVLRFVGGGITPSRVQARDLADLIRAADTLLTEAAAIENPHSSQPAIPVSLKDIRPESVGLVFTSPDTTVMVAYRRIAEDIKRGIFDNFTSKMYDALGTITKFNRRYHCQVQFQVSGQESVLATLGIDIPAPAEMFLNIDTTLYGEITEAGGSEPNVHIRLFDDQQAICRGTESQVKELASRLYETVGVQVTGRFYPARQEFERLRITEILPYRQTSIEDAIAQLAELAGEAYRGVDVEAYISEIRDGEEK